MENLITAAEVARKLGVSHTSVTNWCKSGLVPGAKKVTTVWLIPETSISLIKRPTMGRPTKSRTGTTKKPQNRA